MPGIDQAESGARVAECDLADIRDVVHPDARERSRSPRAVRAMDHVKQKSTKQLVNDCEHHHALQAKRCAGVAVAEKDAEDHAEKLASHLVREIALWRETGFNLNDRHRRLREFAERATGRANAAKKNLEEARNLWSRTDF